MNPNANPPGLFGMFPDKVFPEEVDNIKEFMKDTYTTNINGLVDENGLNINMQRDFDNYSMNGLGGRLSNMESDDKIKEDREQNEITNDNGSNIENRQNPAETNQKNSFNKGGENQNNSDKSNDPDCDKPEESGVPPATSQPIKTEIHNNHKNLKKLR
jgi:hypothetical protein